jgi:hypothetical protein
MATHLVQLNVEVTASGPREEDDVREVVRQMVLMLTPMPMLPATVSVKITGASIDGKPVSQN